MKTIKLMIATSVVLAAAVVGLTTANASAATNNANCKVNGVTPITDLFDTGKNFTFEGNKVTAHFVVTGHDTCVQPVAFATWKSPSKDGHPLKSQILHDSKVQNFGPGTHTMTLNLPECGFWQVDLLNNTRATAADGTAAYSWNDGMFDTMLGEKACTTTPEKPTTPVVQAAQTPANLPKTGAGSLAVSFVGISSLAGVGHALVRRLKKS